MFFTYGGDYIFHAMIVIPVIVGFCRVYFQCHYLGDVTVGGVLGLTIGFIGARMYNNFIHLF